ncbi:hypothetical protein BKH43_01440 [Helicobacter sp. 13S00401-1]|uniref:tRNA pseudouridine(55) synthase TruB n=1 Tax=Helicobacter sp. 13S00401-1 TaxID=1905758 RepID=UPI000BA6EB89|nr:tRNA pseudouridine(55) synthase TruB [Helicobacter sp. 13S00401-1]PAF51329.1 hypothetical protein BKH43_01440 [Helicobacter sp. 13S00401-1]
MLALAYKPPNISSFYFAKLVKKALNQQGFNIDKVGFSGTLDPFAKGQLLLAFNSYTRFLSHVNMPFKTYKATIFLGLSSKSLDTENILSLNEEKHLEKACIINTLEALNGNLTYTPPSFSAKLVDGKRAYALSREGKEVRLSDTTMQVSNLKLLNYTHPFLSFEVSVSKGGYIRSLSEIICNKLGVKGALCSLERLSEGNLSYQSLLRTTKPLYLNLYNSNNTASKPSTKLLPLDLEKTLPYVTIKLFSHEELALNGAKFKLESTPTGIYLVDFRSHFGVIEVMENKEIRYILNRISKC